MNIWWARITPTGTVYILFLLLVSAAAANTVNNTLYITAGLMMGILLFSGLLSIYNLSRLSIQTVKYHEIYATELSEIRILVQNHGKLHPLQGISVNQVPIGSIGKNRSSWISIPVTYPSRGIHRGISLLLVSTYPFGFFKREKKIILDTAVVVYPQPVHNRYFAATSHLGDENSKIRTHFTGEPELKGLRIFQPGDNPRAIHWKKSAHGTDLIVKEYTYFREGKNMFNLPGDVPPREFEEIISNITYGLLKAFRANEPAGVIHHDHVLGPGNGFAFKHRILSFLATVKL